MADMTPQEVEALIRKTAQEENAADIADILVAIGINETGLSPMTPGDKGADGQYHSWGVFHENDGGRGAGLSVAERQNVPNATRRLIKEYRQIAAKPANQGKSAGELAVLTQRPAESHRPGYIQRVNAYMGGRQGQNVPAAPGNPGQDVPKPGGTASSGGVVWPVVGGKVSNKFGGSQARAPGMEGTLPSSNVGLDVAAPEGTAVRAPVRGEVVRVFQSQGGRNAGENSGWGGMVLLKGDDGYFHRLSHLKGGSVSVKPGDKIAAGQQVGQVGSTGNTLSSSGGPFNHLDWEQFKTASGGPDDDKKSFVDPSRGGTFMGDSAGTNTTTRRAGLSPDDPNYQTQRNTAIATAVANSARLQEREDILKKLNEDAKWQDDVRILTAAEKYLSDYAAQWEKDHPGQPLQTPPKEIKKPGLPAGSFTYPWDMVRNPEYDLYEKNAQIQSDYRKEVNGRAKPEKARYDAHLKAIEAAKKTRDDYKTEISDAAGKEFDADQDRLISQSAGDKPTYQIDSPSGSILENGKVIGTVPRDANPGTTFTVPGKGVFIIRPNGQVDLLVKEDPKSTWVSAGDRLVEMGPDGKATGNSIPMGTLTGPTVLGSSTGPKVTIWDPATKTLRTIPNEGYVEPPPTQVTAPKDAEFIVRQGPKGDLIVEKNPSWDPTSRDVTGVSAHGKVYRVSPDGKATLTDTMTPEERAIYDKGKLVELEGKGADTAVKIIDAATKLQEAELKRRQQEIWENVQRAAADPNTSAEDLMGIIQSGAKDAEEWTKILDAHVRQKTQEEVGRANRVKESIDIQSADSRTREGLYRDINETRNQRTNAQRASNEAIAGSGIIGEANSMNVLSAMAPQVGSDGITRAGTIGLGVGAGAITPVKKTWEEHQAELQKLQDQMPSIRMANPNIATPSFAMPRGKSVAPPANGGMNDTIKGVINEQLDRLRGISGGTGGTGGAPGGGTKPPDTTNPFPPGYDPAVAHPVPIQGPVTAPLGGGTFGTAGPTPTEAGDPNAGGSFNTIPAGGGGVMHPALPPAIPGPGTIGYQEEEQPGGGGYSRPRFRAPKPKRRKVAA